MLVRANTDIHWATGNKEKGIKSGVVSRGKIFETTQIGIDDDKAKRMLTRKALALADVEMKYDPGEDKRGTLAPGGPDDPASKKAK